MEVDVALLNDSDLVRVEIGGSAMLLARGELENVINVLEFWYIARSEQDDDLASLINELTDLELQ